MARRSGLRDRPLLLLGFAGGPPPLRAGRPTPLDACNRGIGGLRRGASSVASPGPRRSPDSQPPGQHVVGPGTEPIVGRRGIRLRQKVEEVGVQPARRSKPVAGDAQQGRGAPPYQPNGEPRGDRREQQRADMVSTERDEGMVVARHRCSLGGRTGWLRSTGGVGCRHRCRALAPHSGGAAARPRAAIAPRASPGHPRDRRARRAPRNRRR